MCSRAVPLQEESGHAQAYDTRPTRSSCPYTASRPSSSPGSSCVRAPSAPATPLLASATSPTPASNQPPTCSHAELRGVLLLERCPEALILIHAAPQGVNKVHVLPSHQQAQVPAPSPTLFADAAAAAGPARHPQLGLQTLGDSKGVAGTNNLQEQQRKQRRQ